MKSKLITSSLFLLTLFTTTVAGVQWVNQDPTELSNFYHGLPFSVSILLILGFHEFGHYFAAKYHRVEVTLPHFIPFPPFPLTETFSFLFNPFGTMGAVIRIRSPLQSKRALFDIGIAGPLAGLVVTFAILLYGFFTLPDISYLYRMHPEYATHAPSGEEGFAFGNSLLFLGLRHLFGAHAFVPPMTEIYHYPYLCAGWFGLFVTALNLIPVGQLDGGHIIYALVGPERQHLVAKVFFWLLLAAGLLGLLPLLYPRLNIGSVSWLVWAGILYFIIKLKHPPVPDLAPVSRGRAILGWATFALFVCIFPPVPFSQ